MGRAFNRLPFGKRHEIYAAQLRKQATPAEHVFRAHLAALGLPYRFQHGFFKPHYRIVDFYLPEQNLIVEIDGPYHDREKDLTLSVIGKSATWLKFQLLRSSPNG
jgi:very-short-patch-repair endonuclease